MSKCSSEGDALNKWTDGCQHLGSPLAERSVTTFRAGSVSGSVQKTPVVVTSRGLATPVSSESTVRNTGYADSPTDKLNDWAPSGSSSGSTLGPAKITFDQSSVKKIDREVGTKTDVTSDSPESGTQAAQETPPAPPSTRPYIWKYQ